MFSFLWIGIQPAGDCLFTSFSWVLSLYQGFCAIQNWIENPFKFQINSWIGIEFSKRMDGWMDWWIDIYYYGSLYPHPPLIMILLVIQFCWINKTQNELSGKTLCQGALRSLNQSLLQVKSFFLFLSFSTNICWQYQDSLSSTPFMITNLTFLADFVHPCNVWFHQQTGNENEKTMICVQNSFHLYLTFNFLKWACRTICPG